MKLRFRMLLTGVVLNLCAMDAMAQVPATWLGTWKMNVAKSKYSPGPPPKSQIDKIEAAEGGFKYTSDRVSADGKPARHEYTAKLDGKDYAYSGLPFAATIAVTKVDDHTYDFAVKKGGTLVVSGRNAYSPDGKSRTTTHTGTTAQGEKYESTGVFEKQ